MSEDYDIAIVGSAEVIKPFLALGVICHETADPVEAADYLRKVEQEATVGVVFVAESLAAQIMEDIERVKQRELPAVLILPEYGNDDHIGLDRLENTLSKAIGKKLGN